MKRFIPMLLSLLLLGIPAERVPAAGRGGFSGGGGGARGGGGGGGARPSGGGGHVASPGFGGMSRPAPHVSAPRPQAPVHRPAERPATRPAERPPVHRPNNTLPRANLPETRPAPGGGGLAHINGQRPNGDWLSGAHTGQNLGAVQKPSTGDLKNFLHMPGTADMQHPPQVSPQMRQQLASQAKNASTRLPAAGGKLTEQGRQQVADRASRGWNHLTPARQQQITKQYEGHVSGQLKQVWNKMPPYQQHEALRRHAWANTVRTNFHHHWVPGFGTLPANIWQTHPNWGMPWWRRRPPYYWWGWGSWTGVCGWLPWGWTQPVYYDYGTNVVYDGGVVYVDGQQFATADQFAAQADQLAQAGSNALAATDAALGADDEAATQEAGQWMPLGMFAVMHEDEKQPTMFIDLAVRKDGVIGGVYFNDSTGAMHELAGSVDKQTQRAAWWNVEKKSVVMETGLYNLTHDEATALVHFPDGTTQTRTLVRVPAPDEQSPPPPVPAE